MSQKLRTRGVATGILLTSMRLVVSLWIAMTLAACGASPAETVVASLPPVRAHALLGTRIDLSGLRWLDPVTAHDFAAHRLTLLRWWTVQCPFCADSLPALATLGERFGPRGLALVGVFHAKQPRPPADRDVVAAARARGFAGAIAGDDRWRLLESLRSHGGLEVATSISVLCDDRGIVRWVNTGPRLHPSSDPAHGDAEASFRELERVLAESLR